MGTYVIGSGGDYADFAAAESALTLPEVGGTVYTVTGTVSGHTFSKLNYLNGLTVNAQTGEEATATGTGAFIDGLVTLSTDDFQILFDDLRIRQLNTNSIFSTSQSLFTNCFIGQNSTADGIIFGASTNAKFINCIIVDGADDGVSSAASNVTTMALEKCTIVNASRYGAMRCLMTDVFAFGSGTGDFLQVATGSDYLASEDSTATTTNSFTGRTSADFVDYAGGNYNVTGVLLTAGTAGGSIGAVLPSSSSLSVDSISDTTPQPGDSIVITVSNKAGTITAGDYTITAQDATTVTITVPDSTAFTLTGEIYPTLPFEANTTIVLDDGSNTANAVIQIQVPTGDDYAEITSIASGGFYANDVGVTTGMFGYVYDVVGTPYYDTATGAYALGDGDSFKYRIYNGEWGGSATVSEVSEPVVSTNQIILRDVLRDVSSNVLRNIFED